MKLPEGQVRRLGREEQRLGHDRGLYAPVGDPQFLFVGQILDVLLFFCCLFVLSIFFVFFGFLLLFVSVGGFCSFGLLFFRC